MRDVVLDELTIRTARLGATLRVDWRGRSTNRNPEQTLRGLFKELILLSRQPGTTIEMHFEALEFFNSSTITSVLQFVKELRDARIALVVAFDPANKWQKTFFDALWMYERDDGLFRLRPSK